MPSVISQDLNDGAEMRALEPWHAEEFAEHVARSREHLAQWLPWPAHIHSADDALPFLQRYADRRAKDDGYMFGIWLDGELVGGTMFRRFEAAVGLAEIGVWLAHYAQGRGIMTRAVNHMLDWAFDVRGIHRVEWLAVPENVRSVKLAERLGMQREGLLREYFPHNGKRYDMELWAILSTDKRP